MDLRSLFQYIHAADLVAQRHLQADVLIRPDAFPRQRFRGDPPGQRRRIVLPAQMAENHVGRARADQPQQRRGARFVAQVAVVAQDPRFPAPR